MNKDDRLYPFTVLVTDNKNEWIRSTPCGQYRLWYGKNIDEYHMRLKNKPNLILIPQVFKVYRDYVLVRCTNLYKLLHS